MRAVVPSFIREQQGFVCLTGLFRLLVLLLSPRVHFLSCTWPFFPYVCQRSATLGQERAEGLHERAEVCPVHAVPTPGDLDVFHAWDRLPHRLGTRITAGRPGVGLDEEHRSPEYKDDTHNIQANGSTRAVSTGDTRSAAPFHRPPRRRRTSRSPRSAAGTSPLPLWWRAARSPLLQGQESASTPTSTLKQAGP